MKVARSEHTICYDVDDTLIMWDDNYTKPFKDCVAITCPYDGTTTYHRIHKRHVGFLKKQHAKGYTVVVWSSSGAAWAETVVKALGLEKYVDFVMSKPQKWVDDLSNPAEVLGIHIYLDEKGHST